MLYSYLVNVVMLLALFGAPAAASKGKQDVLRKQYVNFCACRVMSEDGMRCEQYTEMMDATMDEWLYYGKQAPFSSLGKCRDADDACAGNLPPSLTCSYDTMPYLGQSTLLDCSGTTDPEGGAVDFMFNLKGDVIHSESGIIEVQFNKVDYFEGLVIARDACNETMGLQVAFFPAFQPDPDCFNGVRSCADRACDGKSQLYYPEDEVGCKFATQECYGTCELGLKWCQWPVELARQAVTPRDEVPRDGLNTNCDPREKDSI